MLSEVKNVINERIQTNDEDDFNIEKCRNKLIDFLSENVKQTINILEQLDAKEVLYVSEVFEEIAYNLQSTEYIKCLRDIEKKYPNIDISDSIEVAEEYI
ncbi:hypothetical protein C8E03_1321 [Lachnotalea glycerini]|uniref:Uncharacterized protein n=1 Tax=Lachnotalea glycerini TaxID=1763509 RepID=A0A318ELL1_9FIRM|nr:hypothetical protein [Lachnotalea glycerini]PXV84400.1 hypothetical protein C8E03_1321 [Lachnotalea glycerini]